MIGFFPIQILIFRMLRNNADVRRCSYLELGLPVFRHAMQAACYGLRFLEIQRVIHIVF